MNNYLKLALPALIALFVVLILSLLLPDRAHAQTACMDAGVLNDRLTKQAHQSDVGGGRLTPKTILRLYASQDGKTFSVIIVNINGMACLMATGDGFDLTKPQSSSEKEG